MLLVVGSRGPRRPPGARMCLRTGGQCGGVAVAVAVEAVVGLGLGLVLAALLAGPDVVLDLAGLLLALGVGARNELGSRLAAAEAEGERHAEPQRAEQHGVRDGHDR